MKTAKEAVSRWFRRSDRYTVEGKNSGLKMLVLIHSKVQKGCDARVGVLLGELTKLEEIPAEKWHMLEDRLIEIDRICEELRLLKADVSETHKWQALNKAVRLMMTNGSLYLELQEPVGECLKEYPRDAEALYDALNY